MEPLAMASLGALVATTIFLLSIVVVAARVFAWVKRAGFRFTEFEARQTEDGVVLNSKFSRAEFAPARAPRAQRLLPSSAVIDAEFSEVERTAEVLRAGNYKVMEAVAEEDLPAHTRLAIGDVPGRVRVAIATETDVGFTPVAVKKGEKFWLRVPVDDRAPLPGAN